VSGWIAPLNAATAALWIYTPVFPYGDGFRVATTISGRNGTNLDSLQPAPELCAGTFVLRAFSPIRVLLIDGQGRRAGLDLNTGQQLTEIPGSTVTVFPKVRNSSVCERPDGPTESKLRGIRGGVITCSLRLTDHRRALASSDFGNIILDGEHQSVTLNFTQAAGATLTSALKLRASIESGNAVISWTGDENAFSLEESRAILPAAWARLGIR